jgi:ABC-type uncharacterized transport system involved in gliding motility auxiliary subunit
MTIRLVFGIAGILIGLAAAGVGLFYPSKTNLIIVLSVMSLSLLLSFFFVRIKALKTFAGRRATQLGLNSFLMVVFFVFIAVMINLIISQYYFRYDLSSTKKFTLSPQTKKVVEAVKTEINILAFVRGNRTEYEKAFALLDGYRYINRKIITSVYDLDAVPSLAQRYGVEEYGSSVVVYGEKHIKMAGVAEDVITNGIIRITREKKRPIYFVAGHGEHSVDDDGRRGLSRAAESLVAMGYELKPINLAAVGSVPLDASVLMIAGPEIALSEYENDVLMNYSKEGNIFVMLNKEGDHMERFLDKFGISFYNGLAADPVNKMAESDETVPLVSSYPVSPITEGFNLTTVYPTAMGLKRGKYGAAFQYVPIVNSSGSSFIRPSDSDVVEKDVVKGPMKLSILITQMDYDGLMVIFGDADFITNDYYDVSGNGNLFRNIINYLVGETEIVSVSAQSAEFVPLYITNSQSKVIMYVFMIGVPFIVSIAGMALWIIRRRL